MLLKILSDLQKQVSPDFQLKTLVTSGELTSRVDDLDDTVKLLQTFEAAGAHVLYPPGINSPNQLRTVTGSLDIPFNVLASFMPGEIFFAFSECGANRISLGGALNFAAINPVLDGSAEMIENGTFGWLESRADGAAFSKLLKVSD